MDEKAMLVFTNTLARFDLEILGDADLKDFWEAIQSLKQVVDQKYIDCIAIDVRTGGLDI